MISQICRRETNGICARPSAPTIVTLPRRQQRRLLTTLAAVNASDSQASLGTSILSIAGAAVLAATLAVSPARADSFWPPFTGEAKAQTAAPIPAESLSTPLTDLNPDEIATVKLFQRNTPSVVNISNIGVVQNRLSMDVMKIPRGQGSGFVWDTKGHIVTNFHVVRGAAEVRVAMYDQQVYKATMVGGDPTKDIAVLKLDAPPEILRDLKPIVLGHSSNLLVGQKIFAIGNPFGLDHTLTQGIISGLNRQLSGYGAGPSLRNVIQTDAAINPGNSGGPILDSRGRLVGISTAIADPTGKGGSSGVGFAIPVDSVKGLVQQILTFGRVVRPVLGISLGPSQALRQFGLQGVMVLDVPNGSPAAQAGLQGVSRDAFGRVRLGDIIVGFDGKQVNDEGDLFDALDTSHVGQKVTLDVLREGTRKATVSVVLGERAADLAG